MRRGRSVALRRLLVVALLFFTISASNALPGAPAAPSATPATASSSSSSLSSSSRNIKHKGQCDTSNVDQGCGLYQRCMQEKVEERIGFCECVQDYELVDDLCVPRVTTVPVNVTNIKPNRVEESGGGSVAAGLLIPTFLIIIGVALCFGARRYRWLQRFLQYRLNRYGNVLVTRDDDDDDDPIA